MALINKLEAVGDAIRAKTGKTDLLTLDEMVTEIEAIEAGGGDVELPDNAYVIAGNCQYRFANNGWNWFIDLFGNKITTKDITSAGYMFNLSSTLENIPFDLNFTNNVQVSLNRMFDNCNKLKAIPKINYAKPSETTNIFSYCRNLREIPEDIADNWDWSIIDGATSQYSGSRSSMFSYCCSLRKLPMKFLEHGNPNVSYTYSIYYSCFGNCYALDEIVDMPFPHLKSTWTTNVFSGAFQSCCRLKRFTFKTNEDGTPIVVNWKNQVLDFSPNAIGYAPNDNYIIGYNSGITADKEVVDDATYQALKNDPDWYTTINSYCRYNHDSAVETINSLPDASAYLATAGGTNTIKFNGINGSKTDGGAINTLTEEEIAVAAAKGWTVTLA